jgi:hypothetical protein
MLTPMHTLGKPTQNISVVLPVSSPASEACAHWPDISLLRALLFGPLYNIFGYAFHLSFLGPLSLCVTRENLRERREEGQDGRGARWRQRASLVDDFILQVGGMGVALLLSLSLSLSYTPFPSCPLSSFINTYVLAKKDLLTLKSGRGTGDTSLTWEPLFSPRKSARRSSFSVCCSPDFTVWGECISRTGAAELAWVRGLFCGPAVGTLLSSTLWSSYQSELHAR